MICKLQNLLAFWLSAVLRRTMLLLGNAAFCHNVLTMVGKCVTAGKPKIRSINRHPPPPHCGALWFCKQDRDFDDALDIIFSLNYQLNPRVGIKGYSKEISLQTCWGYIFVLRVCISALCIPEAWCWCSAFRLLSFVFDLSELTTVPQVVSQHLRNVTDLWAHSLSSVNKACFGGFL